MTRLLAVDGNSLGHRAFHSSRDAGTGLSAGVRVTGTVVSMLATAWIHGPYDGLLVAFDHVVNRRRRDHAEYKADRAPTPPELSEALLSLRRNLHTAGLHVEVRHGAEADDLLAAAVDACEARHWHCDVLSSDRDLTALVGPRTRLLRPRQRFSQLVVEDEETVRASYGIEPWQYPDLAALRGDPSDGLEGVPGIGPKTAARLVRDHGSVLGLYEHLHVLDPRLEAVLRASRDRVERNLLLMAPIPHLGVDVDRARTSLDAELVRDVLGELGVAESGRRFRLAVTSPPPPLAPPPTSPTGFHGGPVAAPDQDPPGRAVPAPIRPAGAHASGEQAPLF